MAGAPGLLLLTNEQHSYGFTAVSFIKPFWHLLSQLTAMMKRILGWHLEDPRSNLVLPQEPIMSLRESLFFSLWNGNNTFFTKQLWGLVMLTYIKLLAQCLAHTSHSIYDSCHSFYKSRKIFEPQSTAQLCSSPFFNNLLFNDGKYLPKISTFANSSLYFNYISSIGWKNESRENTADWESDTSCH